MCLKSCQRKLQYCTVHPQVAMKGIYQLDYTGQTHFRVSLAAQRGYLITVWTEADIAWLTHSPESIISLMKPQRSEKTGFVIDDTASEPPEYEHAISYSWFAARSSSRFESSVIFFFFFPLPLSFFFPVMWLYACAHLNGAYYTPRAQLSILLTKTERGRD